MYEHAGKICPYCKTPITEANLVTVCPDCGTAHHQTCWDLNNGCANPECGNLPKSKPTYCNQCGAVLTEEQQFCHKCGAAKVTAQSNVCSKCGFELQPDQAFCPKCGTKAGAPAPAAAPMSTPAYTNAAAPAAPKKKKLPLILAGVAIVVVLVLIVSGMGSKGPDFQELYDEYCQSVWADVGSDGSYLCIDTNPYDNDDDGLAYPSAYTAVKNVNRALGLPESVISEMGETTGADGKQTETFEELGVTVSWKYHPDKGLEVTYKRAK